MAQDTNVQPNLVPAEFLVQAQQEMINDLSARLIHAQGENKMLTRVLLQMQEAMATDEPSPNGEGHALQDEGSD